MGSDPRRRGRDGGEEGDPGRPRGRGRPLRADGDLKDEDKHSPRHRTEQG